MPHLRIFCGTPTTKELQVSKEAFTSPPPQPSTTSLNSNQPLTLPKNVVKEIVSQHKESNLEAAVLKRRHNEYKPLEEFVIVEPKGPIQDCRAAHTLRSSADFNHMLLEYEYFCKGEAARCILKIENEILADVNGISKVVAKNTASVQALLKLKKFCWVIKTKQAVDSHTKISKDEMFNELNETSDSISEDNIGNKLLRKMGWSGGGVGKDGSGIAEPLCLKCVLNREGLGLSATKGVTDEFRRKVKEVIENYAASDNQDDLVFSCDFRLEERQIIHDECRRLNLKSKSRGKGLKRYLCVRRKRSVNQLFDHLMSVGGETARYQLVPPGQDSSDSAPNISSNNQSPLHPSCLLGGASAKPQESFHGSTSNFDHANELVPSSMQESKQLSPHNRSSPNHNHLLSSTANNRQVGFSPDQTNPHSQFGNINTRSGLGGSGSFTGQGLLGSYPSQSKFPRNSDDQCVSSNLPNKSQFQPPVHSRGPVTNARNNFPGVHSQNFSADSRSGASNNSRCAPNNATMYPQRNNSPFFRPMGNSFQGQGHPPMPMNPDGFPQDSAGNSSAFNQSDVRGPRMGYNNFSGGNRMSMGMNQNPNQAPFFEGPPVRTTGRSGPGEYRNVDRKGGAGFGGTAERDFPQNHYNYTHHHQQQQPWGTFNFNPNMMGGGYR